MKSNFVSIVVVAFNIPRELRRTLRSLSPTYQQNVAEDEYEILVVDNGSSPPVSAGLLAEFTPNARLVRIDDASPSPAAAVNRGIAEARGDKIGVMIDGARLVTPGLVHYARIGLDMAPVAVVAAPGWYLGSDVQGNAARNGYTRLIEDGLLQSIRWTEDGYRLFAIGTMDEASVDPWFSHITEANALFMKRENWRAIGGMDERFSFPGGGLVNLDTLERAMELPHAQLILTLGEATFHQLHGGVSTNAHLEQQGRNWALWKPERDKLRGLTEFTFHKPSAFVGSLHPAIVPHMTRAAIATPRGVAPAIAAGFRADLKAPQEVVPAGKAAATLTEFAKGQFQQGNYLASADILRIASSMAPAEMAASRLLSTAGVLSREIRDRDATYFVAMGDAHRLIGDQGPAIQHYRRALEGNSDMARAHIGLASIRMTGPLYYEWLERFYSEFKPSVVVEIGVFDGVSLAKVKAPTLAIGIDPSPRASVTLGAETHIFPETSDAFFARGGADALIGERVVGVGFIDGLHTFEQVVKDFANLERYCGRGSVLLIHDTAPLDELTQRVPPVTQFHTGDVWKIVPALKSLRPDLDVFTIATPWTGLTVVSRFGDNRSDAAWTSEALGRFGGIAFADIESEFDQALSLVPNEWEPVLARLRTNGVGQGTTQRPNRPIRAKANVEEAPMNSFLHKYFLNNSGKEIYKWLHYFDIYDRHFHRFRDEKPVVLEIGVFKGGSLQMWRDYFGDGAKIIGIDIDGNCKIHEGDGIEVFIGSQDDSEIIEKIVKKYGRIDIVIDDGSHKMHHIIATFKHLYEHVQPNGVYLVEDTHTSYWSEYGGGLKRPGSFMEFAKEKLDEINAWHTRDAVAASPFTRQTDAICVYDSIVVFEKRPQGKRQAIITGQE